MFKQSQEAIADLDLKVFMRFGPVPQGARGPAYVSALARLLYDLAMGDGNRAHRERRSPFLAADA